MISSHRISARSGGDLLVVWLCRSATVVCRSDAIVCRSDAIVCRLDAVVCRLDAVVYSLDDSGATLGVQTTCLNYLRRRYVN
jgi:hypothetical protein